MQEILFLKKIISGNGYTFILSMSPEKSLDIVHQTVSSDVVTDIAFSPLNAGTFVTGIGNGKLCVHERIGDIKTEISAHNAEISSVEWNVATTILTSSWDGSVRMVKNKNKWFGLFTRLSFFSVGHQQIISHF